jgi:hypothetical protein
MKAEFSNAHLVAYGENFQNNYSPAHAYYINMNPFSQIQICITGDPQYILDKLKKITDEMEFKIKNGEPNKPNEGMLVTTNGYISEVMIPVWNNKVDESVDIDNLVNCEKDVQKYAEAIITELTQVVG